ncbi:MAG: hypothetical protein WC374_12020 [Phycisphaerae bacterium]|jgi:hypothetical protein
MEKIKAFLVSAWAWCSSNKKIVIPVAVALALLVAFGTGYIKGCVR